MCRNSLPPIHFQPYFPMQNGYGDPNRSIKGLTNSVVSSIQPTISLGRQVILNMVSSHCFFDLVIITAWQFKPFEKMLVNGNHQTVSRENKTRRTSISTINSVKWQLPNMFLSSSGITYISHQTSPMSFPNIKQQMSPL